LPQGTRSTPREGPSPRRRHRRFPERENHRDRRERARLRSREEGEGKKAAFAGGYAGSLVMRAKVHAASVFDRDGIKSLMEFVGERFPRLSHLWLDAGYDGKGKGRDWAEKALGFSVEVVRAPRRWVWVPADQKSHLLGPLSPSYRGDGWCRGRSLGSSRTAA
jgi:hypothetical protein